MNDNHINIKALNTKAMFLGLPVNIAIIFFIASLSIIVFCIFTFSFKHIFLSLLKVLIFFILLLFLYICFRILFKKFENPFHCISFILSLPKRAKKKQGYLYTEKFNDKYL